MRFALIYIFMWQSYLVRCRFDGRCNLTGVLHSTVYTSTVCESRKFVRAMKAWNECNKTFHMRYAILINDGAIGRDPVHTHNGHWMHGQWTCMFEFVEISRMVNLMRWLACVCVCCNDVWCAQIICLDSMSDRLAAHCPDNWSGRHQLYSHTFTTHCAAHTDTHTRKT